MKFLNNGSWRRTFVDNEIYQLPSTEKERKKKMKKCAVGGDEAKTITTKFIEKQDSDPNYRVIHRPNQHHMAIRPKACGNVTVGGNVTVNVAVRQLSEELSGAAASLSMT